MIKKGLFLIIGLKVVLEVDILIVVNFCFRVLIFFIFVLVWIMRGEGDIEVLGFRIIFGVFTGEMFGIYLEDGDDGIEIGFFLI